MKIGDKVYFIQQYEIYQGTINSFTDIYMTQGDVRAAVISGFSCPLWSVSKKRKDIEKILKDEILKEIEFKQNHIDIANKEIRNLIKKLNKI